MNVLVFRLSGRTAFFKKPEVNSYVYFTYGNVHKVALLGILGAILGYKGYIQLENREENPEFYNKLKDLKIAICPEKCDMGVFQRKIQTFNNSVGYASEEKGRNLIVKQQWLDNPSWSIYIALDCDEAEKLREYIVNRKCVYMPYLGSNDHLANITDVKIVHCEKVRGQDIVVHSLFPKECGDILPVEEAGSLENPFHYTEFLPVALEEGTNLYIFEKLEYTNIQLDFAENVFHTSDDKNIVFI